jgi:hypothetical protein
MPNKSNKLKNIVINENNNNKSLLDDDISSNNIENINKINEVEDDEEKENIVMINNPELVNENHKNGSNDFLKELLINQIKNIDSNKKLNYGDIKRISKFLTSSIFSENTCSIWNGYVTNEKNQSKGTYINFYYNKKKIALHRLLYINYIGEISNKEYIRFVCDNKGKCCNINHMKKYSYNRNFIKINNTNNNTNTKNINISFTTNDLTVEF